MSNYQKNPKRELSAFYDEMGFSERVNCTAEENAAYAAQLKLTGSLPAGVYQYRDAYSNEPVDQFYTVRQSSLTDAEKQAYIACCNFKNVYTIKKCVVFFTVLTVIQLIAALISVSSFSSLFRLNCN